MTMLILFLTVTLSAWVYSNARSRESEHPVLWALCVFVLPIVFLPLYLIMRPVSFNAPRYLCPYCGNFYDVSSAKCPYCQKELETENAPSLNNIKHRCRFCGKWFSKHQGRCPHCGKYL